MHERKKYFIFGLLAVFILTAAVFARAWSWTNSDPDVETVYGVAYSWKYANDLGLDPLDAYYALIDELGVRNVRLPVYWSEIEHSVGEYDWEMLDTLVSKSAVSNVDLTLVVGSKVPRWPECYIPDWAESFDSNELQKAVLSFIAQTVSRYKDSSAVVRWQVENEPFFPFGQCPTLSVEDFEERVKLVKSLDSKPIMITVSGEMGPWLESTQATDVLGISMYRQTWNDLFGYFIFPLTPEYYFFRAQKVGPYVDQIIVSELQAEPWFPEPIENRPITTWYNVFTKEMFESNIRFVEDTGISEVYLWGAEWWYALKQAGDDRLWNTAKTLFD